MSTLTFDTLKFSRKLESGGFTREQSIVIAEAVAEVQESNLADLATKGDIKDMEAKMRELELRMTIKFGLMQAGTIGVLLTALKLMLPKAF
jgi:hypothetical protein